MAAEDGPDARTYYPLPVDDVRAGSSSLGPFAAVEATSVLARALRSGRRRTRRIALALLLSRLVLGFGFFGLICLWAIWRT